MKTFVKQEKKYWWVLIAVPIIHGALILASMLIALVIQSFVKSLFYSSGHQLLFLIIEFLLFISGLQLIISGKKSFLIREGKHSLSRYKIRLLGFIQLTPSFFALLSLLSLRNFVAWGLMLNTGWAPSLNSPTNILLQNVCVLIVTVVSIIVLRKNKDGRLFMLLATFIFTVLNLANASYTIRHEEQYIEDGSIAYGYIIDPGEITFWKSKWDELDVKSTYQLNARIENIDTSWLQADQVIYLKLQLTIVDSASFPATARILYDFRTGEIYVDSDAMLWHNYLDGAQGWMSKAEFDKILESLGR